MLNKIIQEAITFQRLDNDFLTVVEKWYSPVAQEVAVLKKMQLTPVVLGVQGCQGSGKSTLASFLRILLEHRYHLKAVVLSIDDFYHTRAARQEMAQIVHPLLATRGVPGTHDIALAESVINSLCEQEGNAQTEIPRFDKSTDDRKPKDEWDVEVGAVDIIIFEGWCVGAGAQTEEALLRPINALEAEQDQTLVWRRYVNAQLTVEYAALFRRIDYLLVINAPSFSCVYEWRSLQEAKLKIRNPNAKGVMSEKGLEKFISHYQRLTCHCLETLSEQASWVVTLNKDRDICHIKSKVK